MTIRLSVTFVLALAAIGCDVADLSLEFGANSLASSGGGGTGAGGGTGGALEPGLLGHWTFDDGDGRRTQDSSGRENHGYFHGDDTPVWVTDGRIGGAVHFEGKGCVQMPTLDGPLFPQIRGSLSLWIRPAFDDVVIYNRSLLDWRDESRSHLYVQRPQARPRDLTISMRENGDKNKYAYTVDYTLSNGRWYHLVVAWDTEMERGFTALDGVIDEQTFGDGNPWQPADQFFVMGWLLQASVDDVRLFDRYLSPQEVDALGSP